MALSCDVIGFERYRRLHAELKKSWDFSAILELCEQVPLTELVECGTCKNAVAFDHVERKGIQSEFYDVDTLCLWIVVIDADKGDERQAGSCAFVIALHTCGKGAVVIRTKRFPVK